MRGEPFRGILHKPERKAAVKKRTDRAKQLTRAQVREIVYKRERMICQRCGRKCKRWNETYPSDPAAAHVNENPPRSQGGDPLDPDQCELTCGGCHYTPAGEHCPTADRRRTLLALAAKAKRLKQEAR